MEPLIGGAAFHQACADLRACAESEAEALDPPTILQRLSTLGYDDREIDEIRARNEVFPVDNMPYLLLASLARPAAVGGARFLQ